MRAAGSEPAFLTSQVWRHDLNNDIRTSKVEIIELHSMNSTWSSSGELQSNEGSCIDGSNDLENTFNSHQQERMHSRNRNSIPENGAFERYFEDPFYFNGARCPTPDSADVNAFTETCLTILDKLTELNFDSSCEDFEERLNKVRWDAMEPVRQTDKPSEISEECVTYNSVIDGESCVWMYSFKNKQLLSEYDLNLVNMSSQENLTCSSSSDDEFNTCKCSNRVPSPVPLTHVPRLDLSVGATLPNVTEVTEPRFTETFRRQKHAFTQKPSNNWCLENTQEVTKDIYSNIVWMALSPRKKGRVVRHHNTPIEVFSVPEESKIEDDEFHRPAEVSVEPIDLNEKSTHEQTEMESKYEPEFTKGSSQSSARTPIRSKMTNETYLLTNSAHKRREQLIHCKMGNRILKGDSDRSASFDRDDYEVQRPRIRTANTFLSTPISRPLDNFSQGSWITEQKCPRSLSAGDKMIRNPSYLQTSDWKPFSPLRNSFLNESERTKKTLLQRCVSCFKCCR